MKHNWKQTRTYEAGYRRRICKRCGAIQECFNTYVQFADHWQPAMLNGRQQPFCLGSIGEIVKEGKK